MAGETLQQHPVVAVPFIESCFPVVCCIDDIHAAPLVGRVVILHRTRFTQRRIVPIEAHRQQLTLLQLFQSECTMK